MAGAVFSWLSSPSILVSGATSYDQQIKSGLQAIGNEYAKLAQATAQRIAPWNDVTGAARAGLRGIMEWTGAGFIITLVHSVFYGIFLELGTRNMSPRPSIQPALEQIGGPLMAAIRALVGG